VVPTSQRGIARASTASGRPAGPAVLRGMFPQRHIGMLFEKYYSPLALRKCPYIVGGTRNFNYRARAADNRCVVGICGNIELELGLP
jgi:hypothetical protein